MTMTIDGFFLSACILLFQLSCCYSESCSTTTFLWIRANGRKGWVEGSF